LVGKKVSYCTLLTHSKTKPGRRSKDRKLKEEQSTAQHRQTAHIFRFFTKEDPCPQCLFDLPYNFRDKGGQEEQIPPRFGERVPDIPCR